MQQHLADTARRIRSSTQATHHPRTRSGANRLPPADIHVSDPRQTIRDHPEYLPSSLYFKARRVARLSERLAASPQLPQASAAEPANSPAPPVAFPLSTKQAAPPKPLTVEQQAIFTDGSHKKGRIGAGVCDTRPIPPADYSFSAGKGTVLRAELLAILFALSLRAHSEPVNIYTDSLVSLFLLSRALAFPPSATRPPHARS